MNFTQAIATVFKKYATFSGRAARPEFWWFALASWAANLIATLALPTDKHGDNALTWILFIVLLLPSLTVGVRRLHDTGRSGHFMWLAFIPLIGLIVLITFWASEGNPETNKYGEPPVAPAKPAN